MSTDETLTQFPPAEHPSDASTRRSNSHADSLSGSDSELLPLTPSSGIVSNGMNEEVAAKRDPEVIDVDMAHGTEQAAATSMEVDSQGQTKPSQAGVEDEDEAAQYTQPAELLVIGNPFFMAFVILILFYPQLSSRTCS
jgi:hypothetical protein